MAALSAVLENSNMPMGGAREPGAAHTVFLRAR